MANEVPDSEIGVGPVLHPVAVLCKDDYATLWTAITSTGQPVEMSRLYDFRNLVVAGVVVTWKEAYEAAPSRLRAYEMPKVEPEPARG